MALTSRILASGPGWSVADVTCTSGPHDRPYEERHATVSIAAVTNGTFQYRSVTGRAMLAPGGLLLGNADASFECGHEHGIGDRCIAFQLEPAFLESIVREIPGVRRMAFAVPYLPPRPELVSLLAAAEAARDTGRPEELEEIALQLAATIAAMLAGSSQRAPALSVRDERRISDVLRLIEAAADQPLALADLARAAGMSPYHFLRTFRKVVGITPHQYLLRTRLHRAAVRLRSSDAPISTIAFDAGFGDLSTFNRRFRHLMGCNPGSFARRSIRPGRSRPSLAASQPPDVSRVR